MAKRDITERLRDVAGFVQKERGRVEAAACLATEAADEIERLREAPNCGSSGRKDNVIEVTAADAVREGVIRECVTWLAMNHADFKPECLAGEMARDLLSSNRDS